MKKALLLLLPILAHAAGTCTVGTPVRLGSSPNWTITINCTGDASTGSFPAASLSYISTTQTQLTGYFIYRVTVKPGSPAPTASYSVTVTDINGVDMLANAGSGLSATAAQSFNVINSVPLVGSENVNFTGNSVASATTQITLYVGPSLSAGSYSSGSSSSVILGSTYIKTTESTASTSFVDLTTPDSVTFTLNAPGNISVLYIADSFSASPGNTGFNEVFLDGSDQSCGGATGSPDTSNQRVTQAVCKLTSLTAGSHTIDIKHRVDGGSAKSWLNRMVQIFSTP
jgi:hypothetical protein